MHFDPYVGIAGLIVGFVVGLTGMGGGALMTPILVLLFKVEPLTAVSSDLVAALVMKPVGGAVHYRRGTVSLPLVRWLMVGSVPAAFAGVLILRAMGSSTAVQDRLKIILGVALLVACGSIVAKAMIQRRRAARLGVQRVDVAGITVKPVPTVLIGVLGGLVVGMTSVGSGSLIIVMLLMLYPRLTASSLVGTDLVQAIPLVASAALGHILFGDFALGLTASMLAGSLPGVYFGARLSSRAPDAVIRRALVFVLLASGLKLVNLGTVQLASAMGAIAALWVAAWSFRRWAPQQVERLAVRSRWLAARTERVAVAAARPGAGFAARYMSIVRPKLVPPDIEPSAVDRGPEPLRGLAGS